MVRWEIVSKLGLSTILLINLIHDMFCFTNIANMPTDSEIIFNEINTGAKCISNFVCILAKYHVYKTRCTGDNLNI